MSARASRSSGVRSGSAAAWRRATIIASKGQVAQKGTSATNPSFWQTMRSRASTSSAR